jgi:carboxypeptidase C (cathepsin A)
VRKRDLAGIFGGQRISYRATIADTILANDEGKAEAVIVTTSYVKLPADPARPVLFLYNGGPGAGSVWLQMGAFGPKRVALPSDARDDGAPPYPLLDNPDCLLDVADLVFIDPPGTGFSYLIEGTDPKKYYGLRQDARAVAQVIRRWLNDNGRWASPKYLGGESYGTSRTALVVDELEGSTYNDVGLNGLILISTILDFAGREPTPGNELAYVVTLPSMAAAAYYHGKVTAPSLEAIVAEARGFAIGPYAAALLKGEDLPQAERAAVRRELARLTGLPETYLEQANLRVTDQRFYKELLRDRGSMPAIPARIMTMPARRPMMIRASTASMRAIPPRSTSGRARRSATPPTGNTSRSALSAGSGTGRWGAAGAGRPISTSPR